jgi:K+-transporting ATPase ATPase A chain
VTASALGYQLLFLGVLTACAVPLGAHLARVYQGESGSLTRLLAPLERWLLRTARVRADEDMSWPRYAACALLFNLLGLLAVYALQRLQGVLPLNPACLPGVPTAVAFNTAVSFASNTNWQAYGGETTMSPLTQMLGLTVQNFLSAATGLAVLAALIRGFVRVRAQGVGSFWVDLVRVTVHLLLPLAVVLALALASQGVVQTFAAQVRVPLLEPTADAEGAPVTEQVLATGPAASQVAIKQLGTNGGGFYNVNSAHPFENPTAFSNFLQTLAILLIPAACCFAFGTMVRDRRQGVALYATMLVVFVPLLLLCTAAEQAGNPALTALGADPAASALAPGGNMEGKELRFGIGASALWASATTAASNGSVNSMHDSYLPLGGLVPMLLMQLGEVIFGGVGSGLYGLLAFAIVGVFVAGLMVGRTPEYLGKKIEAHEMKMASLVILVPPAAVLVGTAIACLVPEGRASLANPGAHGFSEILYAFSSGANNNGSAFGGLTASGPFFATAIGIAMWIGRYWLLVPILAIAGSLAAKKRVPASVGTLPTHGPLFVVLLAGTILLVGALAFLPALALGPLVEHLVLFAR